MAEPIGIASGLLALDTFAFTSSVSLYQAVESFQNNQRTIRELKEEVEALNGVCGLFKRQPPTIVPILRDSISLYSAVVRHARTSRL